jgi:hypothetical protein
MLAVTALTAAFTGVLAAFAIVTAWYARKAFLGQSDEVNTLKDQLRDQQDLNAKQTPVLELQAQELRESLAERKRSAAEREREAAESRRTQASRVYMWEERHASDPRLIGWAAGAAAQEGHNGPTVTAHIKNSSDQPVYHAEFSWHGGTASHGSPNPEPLGTIMPGDETSKIRVFPQGTNLEVSGAVVRFTDAAGIRWLRRPDGDLTEVQQQ